MGIFLGIDTSNYTTSAALYDSASGEIRQERRLLSVKSGEKGLRQSEAVFQHVKALPELMEALLRGEHPQAVTCSARPRDEEGSYMPCFLVGEGAARCLAAAMDIPFFAVSHQAGHVAAALFSAGRLDLLGQRFLAFHVSGGTTELLLCSPGKGARAFFVERMAASLDLKAGQAVDRVGLMLGLPFPAGPALEALALQSARRFRVKPTMKGCDCSLSGLENRCAELHRRGQADCDVALFCLESIGAALAGMADAVLGRLGEPLPFVFAGGVMSNSILRGEMGQRYNAVFAAPGFSSDNAAGVAVLGALSVRGA